MIQQTQTQAHTTHDIKVHELRQGNVFFPYCHLQLSYLAIATRIPAMLPLWTFSLRPTLLTPDPTLANRCD